MSPVWPGDVIVGDGEGVVVIPAHLADEIADEAVEMTAFEDFVTEEVLKGRSILGLYPATDEQTLDRLCRLAPSEGPIDAVRDVWPRCAPPIETRSPRRRTHYLAPTNRGFLRSTMSGWRREDLVMTLISLDRSLEHGRPHLTLRLPDQLGDDLDLVIGVVGQTLRRKDRVVEGRRLIACAHLTQVIFLLCRIHLRLSRLCSVASVTDGLGSTEQFT